jgi:hypothetical protein
MLQGTETRWSSPNGAGRAQEFGYPNAVVMPEGIARWEKAKLPIETG